MTDARTTSRREFQLDAISTLLIISMALIVSLLLYFLSSSGVELPALVPLANYVPRVLLGAFVLLVVGYLWEQRIRLRRQVSLAIEATENARARLAEREHYLAFSHQAASALGAEGVEAAMTRVLHEAAELFEADAAAVIGEESDQLSIADPELAAEAERALTHAALVATGKGGPMHIESLGTESGQAIAVPLRVQGDLRYVLVLWKCSTTFAGEQLDALGLMGRMVELAIEREESLLEAQQQVEGTLRVLQYLVVDKLPDYSRHATAVGDLAFAIGQKLGLTARARKDLRLAGLIHDVGMMDLQHEVGDAGHTLTQEEAHVVRQHPRIGSEIAAAANFDSTVKEAVAGHHERTNGTGYPLGLHGAEITMAARIVSVCEVYDSMTHRSDHNLDRTEQDALGELQKGSGVLYDAQVVRALRELVTDQSFEPHMKEADDGASTEPLTKPECEELAALRREIRGLWPSNEILAAAS